MIPKNCQCCGKSYIYASHNSLHLSPVSATMPAPNTLHSSNQYPWWTSTLDSCRTYGGGARRQYCSTNSAHLFCRVVDYEPCRFCSPDPTSMSGDILLVLRTHHRWNCSILLLPEASLHSSTCLHR